MAKNCHRCGKQLSFRNAFVFEKKPICKECLDSAIGKEKASSVAPKPEDVKPGAGSASSKTPPVPVMSDVRVPLSLVSTEPYTFGEHVGQVWSGMVAKWGLLAMAWLFFQVSKSRKNWLLGAVIGIGVLIVLSIIYALLGALFTYSKAKTRNRKVFCQNCNKSLIINLDVLKKNSGESKKGVFPCPNCKAGLEYDLA